MEIRAPFLPGRGTKKTSSGVRASVSLHVREVGRAFSEGRRSDAEPGGGARQSQPWPGKSREGHRFHYSFRTGASSRSGAAAGREALNTFAAGYAAAGRFREATGTARRALALATQPGLQSLENVLRTRPGLHESKVCSLALEREIGGKR